MIEMIIGLFELLIERIVIKGLNTHVLQGFVLRLFGNRLNVLNLYFKKHPKKRMAYCYGSDDAHFAEMLNIVQNEADSLTIKLNMKDVEIKEKEAFAMAALTFSEPQKWGNYCKAGYALKFNVEMSGNIRQVRFEIKRGERKDSFVTRSIEQNVSVFTENMESDLLSEWNEVGEICFIIPLDVGKQTVVGEVKIHNFIITPQAKEDQTEKH